MEGMRGDASDEGVAVVKTGGDEGMDKGFSSRGGEAVSDFGDAAEVEVGGLDNGTDIRIKRERGVQDNTKIACQGEGVMVEASMVSEMAPVLLTHHLITISNFLRLQFQSCNYGCFL